MSPNSRVKMKENAQETSFEGGCGCRHVRYRVTSKPMFVHGCHCRWCQRETGSAFAHNALIECERVQLLQGDVVLVDTPSQSGKGQMIARCPKCHIALWSHYAQASKAICFLRVGTLDNPDAMPPDIHIFVASKQPWVSLPADVPAVPGYYKMSEHWPEESIERRAALRHRNPGKQ